MHIIIKIRASLTYHDVAHRGTSYINDGNDFLNNESIMSKNSKGIAHHANLQAQDLVTTNQIFLANQPKFKSIVVNM